ncbi:TPA: ribbon-helix-helix protein, CopG family [Staphylococcus aureus]|nr:ribbon-helix-helix protein, CopG family [Staphylococcus aureus]HDN0321425.1 ribbon-helix-helix protein, CopG family [Staphylococcus aureus]HDN0566274.1 ribbon-helix-helix protein, CopG family [Staphylococcus aureus]HDN0768080.1 ribbon-helix-helix protein, CopG family [Staphylococcus aureus]HDN0771120.1 ribbon-helix-helix protein, CopG family [Staphylococcus aureus]
METRDIKIRSVDVETIKRIDRMAKQKNISRNEFLLDIIEQIDPLECYQSLYAEQSHQQAQNTKALKELADKIDRVYNTINDLEY